MSEDNVLQLVKMIDSLREGQHEICDGQTAILHRLDVIEAEQKIFRSAFPAGDLEGHSRYHQAIINMKEENRKLRRAIIEKTLSALIWATIVWLAMLAWKEFAALVTHIVGMNNVGR